MADYQWIDYSYDESLPYTSDDFCFVGGKKYYSPDHPPRHMTVEEQEVRAAHFKAAGRAWKDLLSKHISRHK